jgi:16S rRNA G966 N2-methylase RsmD
MSNETFLCTLYCTLPELERDTDKDRDNDERQPQNKRNIDNGTTAASSKRLSPASMIKWIVLTVWSLIATHHLSSHDRAMRQGSSLAAMSSDAEGDTIGISMTETDHANRRRPCVLQVPGDYALVSTDLAAKLSLPLVTPEIFADDPSEYTHALSILPYEFGNVRDYTVAIQSCESQEKSSSRKRRASSMMKPFFVDFCPLPSSRLARRTSGDSGPDLLTKAVAPRKGIDSNSGATVYDLTAGLGQDSLLIANAGAKMVHMVERDPIVAALLEDALRRLRILSDCDDNDDTRRVATDLSSRLSLEIDDGRRVLETILTAGKELPDIVYLDPMFPVRKKSASVKKNMQVLHSLLESQQGAVEDERLVEELELLQAAYQAAKLRVVVKRPTNAEPLGGSLSSGLKPSYQTKGSVNRWDVYVKNPS